MGFDRRVDHLSGVPAPLNRTVVTADGESVTLDGQGMPTYGEDEHFGALIVTLRVRWIRR